MTYKYVITYVYITMIYSAGFRIICMCLANEQMPCCAVAKKGTSSAKHIFFKMFIYVLKLVTLQGTPSLQICGRQKQANIWPPFAEVSCAWVLLVLYVWYLKWPSSDRALREQKKSEQSDQTASEKRPNAITLSLVWVISSKSFLSCSNLESSVKSFTSNRMQAKHPEAKP